MSLGYQRLLGLYSSGGAAQPLMSVAMENFLNTADQVLTGFDSYMMFRPYTIGSGDVSGIRFSFSARRLSPGGSPSAATDPYTVTNCYINNAANNVQSPQITFNGGATTLAVTSGAYDQQSDLILPSALGLGSFVRGSVVWLKCILTFTTSANLSNSAGLTGNWAGASLTNGEFYAFSSGVTTATNITTPGKFTWTGTNPTAQGTGMAVVMLGTFASGSPPVYYCAGDSIMYGLADTGTAGAVQRGIFNRAIWDDGTAARKLACINASVSGLVSTAYTQEAFGLSWGKYCNRAVVEVGTNDFTNTGTGQTPGTVETRRTSIYTTLRANNASMKIIDTLLGPRTSSVVSVSSISGDGTTCTATTTSAFVSSIGGIGATRTCVIAGATPAGYNTVAAGVTMTVASATTVTYLNATTGASSGTITISDIWQTETNQTWGLPTSGVGWSTGNNVDTFNTWVTTNGNEAYVDFPQWHGVVARNWAAATPPNTIDGLHPNGATINTAMAATLRTTMDAIG